MQTIFECTIIYFQTLITLAITLEIPLEADLERLVHEMTVQITGQTVAFLTPTGQAAEQSLIYGSFRKGTRVRIR